MPRIKEYFSDAKITPNDRGTAAFEQAGRRVGGFYEQIARAREQVGSDIGKLWQQVRFELDAEVDKQENLSRLDATQSSGGGGGGTGGFRTGGGRGGGDDLLRMAADRGSNGPNGNPNLPNEYNRGASYKAAAASNIGRAAAGLPSIINKVIQGQGLTDSERALYNASGYGQKHTLRGWELDTDPKKGGIAPNPDVSYDDAVKAGYNTDGTARPGQPVPTYPFDPMSTIGLPNIQNTTTDPDLLRVQSGGPEALPNTDKAGNITGFPEGTPDWATQPGGMATDGGSIWSNIVQQVGGLWPVGNSGGSSAPDEESTVGGDDNPVQ